jgi:hypothetical protein
VSIAQITSRNTNGPGTPKEWSDWLDMQATGSVACRCGSPPVVHHFCASHYELRIFSIGLPQGMAYLVERDHIERRAEVPQNIYLQVSSQNVPHSFALHVAHRHTIQR